MKCVQSNSDILEYVILGEEYVILGEVKVDYGRLGCDTSVDARAALQNRLFCQSA